MSDNLINETDRYTIGSKIFRDYTLKRFIGEKNFGRYYLVENMTGIPFALKVIYPGNNIDRLLIHTIACLRSNRLVSILDYGETIEGEECMILEFMHESLEDALRAEPINEITACKYFLEILQGLKVLENNHIVHKDIKPTNLFILEDIIKIGDFSIAERFTNNYNSSVDRWAAAAIFYRMLTGKSSFNRDLANVPEKYRSFLHKCFEKDVKNRYQNVSEMLQAFYEQIINKLNTPLILEAKNFEVIKKKKHNLRSTPRYVSEDESEKIFGLTKERRPIKYTKNEFVDNENSTVTDLFTGLMWQKFGSDQYMKYEEVKNYIKKINQEKFVGYADWRLPTTEELMSLLTPEKQSNDLFINPIFSKEQFWCWSSDKIAPDKGWFVIFLLGTVIWLDLDNLYYVRAVRTI
ncbi:MAG: DUF1566 domain-containing protein [Desulfobacterales bacterium]|nr:DUF1566 domain-containing protein [Desulfobacterales bacterium]